MNKNQLPALKEHHSASDWDFNFANWTITTLQYVSPPSCIWWDWPAALWWYQLCKHPGTEKLPEGRLVTWVRTQYATNYIYLFFRNTAAIGTSNPNSCYYARMRANEAIFRVLEYEGGVYKRSWLTAHTTFAINTWHRYRLSWWLSWGVLQVRLEHDVAGEWVQDGDDISISDALFGEEAIQRTGLGGRTQGNNRDLWWDDTEIWEYE